ncbi:MAG: hypothetical protein KME30_18985 [Iphinoe sp. HA4291-MV1]|jgi:hypothetical protein|nr:hypothetical protein [Iphinoe sp. HA4291-MV1]
MVSLENFVGMSDREIILEAESFDEAQNMVRTKYQTLALWAQAFGMERTSIKFPGCERPFRIPSFLSQRGGTMTNNLIIPMGGIQIAEMHLSRALIQVLLEFDENPDMSAGLVRLSDERQVAVTAAAARFVPNNDAEELVRLRRQDYWWLPDLENFNRNWRQQLEPNNLSSMIEYSYRSEADRDRNWGRYTTRYRLIQDDFGVLYHVCYSVGVDMIPALR